MQENPFRVQGIALVVDKRGKGAHMVFRYPAVAPSASTNDPGSSGKNNRDTDSELFFSLPSRQMAKLFRPNKALCGKPMTLSVGGTVFCCCAHLMEDKPVSHEAEGNMASSLVLFSVIVSLTPRQPISTLPVTGWFEKRQRQSEKNLIGESIPFDKHPQQQASFSCIRRVHLSLARLCRLLEREEYRCGYISKETDRFQQKHAALRVVWERRDSPLFWGRNTSGHSTADPVSSGAPSSATGPTVSSTASSPVSLSGKKVAGGVLPHRRTHSFNMSYKSDLRTTPTTPAPVSNSGTPASVPSKHHRRTSSREDILPRDEFTRSTQENECLFQQELLDILMADTRSIVCRPQQSDEIDDSDRANDEDSGNEEQSSTFPGNLARELVQIHHALARHDRMFRPSAAALLSGRNGIVFMNRHLSVKVEAASEGVTTSNRAVLPSETLLFPHATASELLGSMSNLAVPELLTADKSASTALSQLLSVAHAQKSLEEMSHEAHLTLNVALAWATRLVDQGVCISAPVLTGRLVVSERWAELHKEHSLEFAQLFGLPLTVVVAHLTSSATQTLDDMLAACHNEQHALGSNMAYLDECYHRTLGSTKDAKCASMEDWLYQLVVWLYSRGIIVVMEKILADTQTHTGKEAAYVKVAFDTSN